MPVNTYEAKPVVTNSTQGLAIIMRGLPGSGKSHWVNEFIARQAAEVRERFFTFGYFSTDSLFYRDDVYQFDVKRLSEFHQRNLTGFIQALSAGEPIVICDNTNLARWESMAYEAAAKALGFQVRYVLVGDPKDSAHQVMCAKRNSHGVPLSQIIKMANSFEEF
ncbi:ATP-binding protein [Shewanella woodyi]|uniref:ATP-binding protein n=1 Tax=Shewanella woodyi (strain ATCC 51908 / MS32) TaxID=392500 RepID=B1KPH5_SHEWM|nr:ATP-binding protein [Shewanella woodyi]ACA86128.1 conserved hypothetical protein [Shewanella woodyi ATCC 51908]